MAKIKASIFIIKSRLFYGVPDRIRTYGLQSRSLESYLDCNSFAHLDFFVLLEKTHLQESQFSQIVLFSLKTVRSKVRSTEVKFLGLEALEILMELRVAAAHLFFSKVCVKVARHLR